MTTTDKFDHRPYHTDDDGNLTPIPDRTTLAAIAHTFDALNDALTKMQTKYPDTSIWAWFLCLVCEHESHSFDDSVNARVCDDCGAIEAIPSIIV